MKETIAVLGGGHGGHAVAADMTLAGHNVRLYEEAAYAKGMSKVFETKEIVITGAARNGTARLEKVTSDLKEAVEGAGYIFIVVPAFVHKKYAEELAPILSDGQVVVFFPGTFGSLVLAHEMHKRGIRRDVVMAEANSCPYATRVLAPGASFVYGCNHLMLGVFPAVKTEEVVADLSAKFYKFQGAKDVLDCGLLSLNPVAHTAGCVLNAGRIERSRGDFYLYDEGITPSVARVMEAVDDERLAIRKAFGYELVSFAQAYAGDMPARSIWVEMNGSLEMSNIKGPENLKSRYLTEDIPFGLLPWSQIGKAVGVPTPFMDAFITIGYRLSEISADTGRKIEEMGISGKDVRQIRDFVHSGH